MEACKEDHVVVTNRHAFDCCICSAFLTIPVFECDNGHIVCSTCCYKRQGKCHECSKHNTLRRCKAIENILQYIKISCPNEEQGYLRHSKHKFSYDDNFSVSLKYNDEAIVLQAATDGKLFILNNRTRLMGKVALVNISFIGPNSSNDEYSYDILARSKKCSMKLRSCPKNIQKTALATNSSEFLMIPFPFGYFSSSKPLTLEIRINRIRMMNIFIMMLTGESLPLRVKSSDTILDVKLKIRDKKGYPVEQTRLIQKDTQLGSPRCFGKQLDDCPTVADYKIEENSMLYMVLRLVGS